MVCIVRFFGSRILYQERVRGTSLRPKTVPSGNMREWQNQPQDQPLKYRRVAEPAAEVFTQSQWKAHKQQQRQQAAVTRMGAAAVRAAETAAAWQQAAAVKEECEQAAGGQEEWEQAAGGQEEWEQYEEGGRHLHGSNIKMKMHVKQQKATSR